MKFFKNLIFIIGLCLILFPILSKFISDINQTRIINNYNNHVSQMSKNDIDELKNNANEFNNKLYENNTFDSSLSQDNISTIDLFGTEIIAYISIPKIDVNLPIFEGSSDAVLQKGIGHLSNTSYPIGGNNTHCVLVRAYWAY